ncbi:hypothetical protein VHTUMSATKI_37730 [Vibrio harveyi]|uniref:hypothetical protein n=1 Tax=Vibrio harveyi TaxID=669 RepID=UPI0036F354F1
MKKLISLFVLFVSLSSNANATDDMEDKFSIFAGGWSYHLVNQQYLNSKHDLFGVEYKNWLMATFKNSYGDPTYTVGYDFNWQSDYFDYGVAVGANYGYCGDNQVKRYTDTYGCETEHLFPLVMPYVSYSQYDIQPTIGMMFQAVVFTVKIKL